MILGRTWTQEQFIFSDVNGWMTSSINSHFRACGMSPVSQIRTVKQNIHLRMLNVLHTTEVTRLTTEVNSVLCDRNCTEVCENSRHNILFLLSRHRLGLITWTIRHLSLYTCNLNGTGTGGEMNIRGLRYAALRSQANLAIQVRPSDWVKLASGNLKLLRVTIAKLVLVPLARPPRVVWNTVWNSWFSLLGSPFGLFVLWLTTAYVRGVAFWLSRFFWKDVFRRSWRHIRIPRTKSEIPWHSLFVHYPPVISNGDKDFPP